MTAADVALLTGRIWLPLGRGDDAPQVPESATLTLRGLDNGETVRLGPFEFRADDEGCLKLRLSTCDQLRGHLGLIEVVRESGTVAGEFEVVPDKMSEGAFQTLRGAMERIWAGLIFDPSGVSRVRGELPSPGELWRSIETPVREIAAEPRTVLVRAEGVKRLEAVRRPSELTASVIRAAPAMVARARGPDSVNLPAGIGDLSDQQRQGRSPVLVRSVDTAENSLVTETLRRLVFYARRHPAGADVATRSSRLLRQQPFASCSAPRHSMEAARLRTLHDSRYRCVEKVLRILDRPEAFATEGPGEARLGVKAISRLYEYWVLLQVLGACSQRYGAPLDPGFDILGTRSRSGTVRLGIPAGATVSFPGDIHVGFEPRIEASGQGWQGLENVPHPDRQLAQNLITPDVGVLRRGTDPALVVFDAKYVGRHWVDYEAAKIHARYSRIRLHGRPIVRNVLAAHPHHGKDSLWAGYGSVTMVPGEPSDLRNLLP